MDDEDKLIARAKRVIDELVARGWWLEADNTVAFCPVCRYELESGHNYCPQCGTKIPTSYHGEILDDVVAALAKGDEE